MRGWTRASVGALRPQTASWLPESPGRVPGEQPEERERELLAPQGQELLERLEREHPEFRRG